MSTPGKRVLIVEDHDALRDLLATSLQMMLPGAEVYAVSHGMAALGELVRLQHVDLILSDIMLPVMDGARLVRQLAADERMNQIPVILLTAVDPEVVAELRQLPNVVDYFIKPANMTKVIMRVQQQLAG